MTFIDKNISIVIQKSTLNENYTHLFSNLEILFIIKLKINIVDILHFIDYLSLLIIYKKYLITE